MKLARWLVDNGNDGLVLAGTTGEAPALSDQEKHDLWKAVREVVGVPVIASTGTASTAHSVELTKMAADVGADAALVVTPYYNRPSQAGIEAHFRAIAQATRLPVIAYDIPKRTGRELRASTLARLAGDGVIAGLKDAEMCIRDRGRAIRDGRLADRGAFRGICRERKGNILSCPLAHQKAGAQADRRGRCAH